MEFNDNPPPTNVSIRQINEKKETEKEFTNDPITAPAEEGVYYYEIFAEWLARDNNNSLGEASYIFMLEVS